MSKLAIVLKGYPRLSETFIAQEIKALEESGVDIELISLRHPTDKDRHSIHASIQAKVNYLPEYLRNEPRRVILAFVRQVIRPGFWKALFQFTHDFVRDRTVNRVRRFGQAVVLASELPIETRWIYAHFIHTPGSVARYASIIRRIPFSLSAHAKDIWTIECWEIREKLNDARWTVCCTKAYSQYLRQEAPSARIIKLYHGLDLNRFPAHAGQLRGKNELRVVTVARAVEKKGLDTLLHALSMLPSSINWRLSHVGGGPLSGKLDDLARKLGIEERVHWHGAQPQSRVLELLREGDVFCLPARLGTDGDRDGLPNALMEALSQGLPVITTDIGGISELIDESCGILVPPDEPLLLANALRELAENPVRRQEMGQAGRRIIEERFGFADNVQALIKLLDESLDR